MQRMGAKLVEGKAKYDEKCAQVKALKRTQNALGLKVEAIVSTAAESNHR